MKISKKLAQLLLATLTIDGLASSNWQMHFNRHAVCLQPQSRSPRITIWASCEGLRMGSWGWGNGTKITADVMLEGVPHCQHLVLFQANQFHGSDVDHRVRLSHQLHLQNSLIPHMNPSRYFFVGRIVSSASGWDCIV